MSRILESLIPDQKINQILNEINYDIVDLPFQLEEENEIELKSISDIFLSDNEIDKENDDFSVYFQNEKKSDTKKAHILFGTNKDKNTESKTIKIRKLLFEVVYPEIAGILTEDKPSGKRRDKKYNILNKLGRHFFNKYLIKKITSIIQEKGNPHCFYKLPQNLVLNAVKMKNRKIWDMKLIQILESKDFYTQEELISHYYPNLKAINSIKLEENILNKTEINNILNMKICDLYNEYLETIEFKKDIEEISKIEGEKYGIKYKNYAEAFLKD